MATTDGPKPFEILDASGRILTSIPRAEEPKQEYLPAVPDELERKRAERRLKATPDVVAAIIKDLEIGVAKELACESAGIARSTFYRWLDGDDELAGQLTRACARGGVNLHRISLLGGKGSAAAMFHLERRFRSYYGDIKRHELTGADGGPIETKTAEDFKDMSREELQRIADGQ